jgi:chorismate mutase / prephenate dehydratase
VADQIGKQKSQTGSPIVDKSRENAVMDKVKSIACWEKINPADIEKIYRQIMAACRGVQGITAGFQGEVGAFSEEAAFQFFGSGAHPRPFESLEDVFRAVEQETVLFGVVPVENSTEGSISRTYDLFLDSDLKVCGETELRVVHCLIGLPDGRIDSIRKVYSHPQALGQCQNFLRKMGWQLIPSYDTAGSVKMIKEQNLSDSAAIASARSAEYYGMKILARGIEDNPQNFTRFFVLSKRDSPPTGKDKTSIVFSVKHKPGALYESLKEMSERRINLTKIESRPTRQRPWEYNFYADFDGHREDAEVREALGRLEESTIFLKVLGSYPRFQ